MDIPQWLDSVGCSSYKENFLENEITGDLLFDFDTSVLKDLGITKVGDRIKILVAIAKLKKSFARSHPKSPQNRQSTSLSVPNSATLGSMGSPVSDDGFGTYYSSLTDYYRNEDNENEEGTGTSTLTNSLENTVDKQILSMNEVRKGVVKFIYSLLDGTAQIKSVNVSGCFNAESIINKALAKYVLSSELHGKANPDDYNVYLTNEKDNHTTATQVYDSELVTICHSSSRDERNRIIICQKDLTPNKEALEASRKIASDSIGLKKRSIVPTIVEPTVPPNVSDFAPPPRIRAEKGDKLRQFFGQRPPSELISTNLAEYFPKAKSEELEQTIRNSVRYSIRMSRMSFSSLGPRPISVWSASSNPSSGVNPTVGDVWINGATSLDEATISSTGSGGSSGILGNRPVSTVGSISGVLPPPPGIRDLSASPLGIRDSVSSGDMSLNRMSVLKRLSTSQSNRFSILSSASNRMSRMEIISAENEEFDSDETDTLSSSHSGGTINGNNVTNTSLDSSDSTSNEPGTTTSAESESSEFDFITSHHNTGPKHWIKGAHIGSGSFGTVCLGMNSMTGEIMAVKQVNIPSEENLDEMGARQRGMIDSLQREMGLLRELHHENIVSYFGSSVEDGNINIFIEYVPGGSVSSMLGSYGPFEEPLVRSFVRQILIGLNYLHDKNIIHRDIKGANVLIDLKGGVKITDFGISKKVNADLLNSNTRRASMQGSVYWMAPEVVKQIAYTPKADIWSVGCLVVEMFTGKHPFPNYTQMQAIFRIGAMASPEIPKWCSEDAKDFLAKTFVGDYQERQSALELLSHRFLDSLLVSKK